MKVALGQCAVQPEWQSNLAICTDLMRRAAQGGADLLVLPEGILVADITDPARVLSSAQPLDGPFITALAAVSRTLPQLTLMTALHVPAGAGRVSNVLITMRNGELLCTYRKLHLYDAFAVQESENVIAGDDVPPLLEIAGLKVGVMTCYDVRFPELARRLAAEGAEVLVLVAAWVQGPLKKAHWEVLVTARALENTSYMVAVGECGEKTIGHSMVVDPLGVVVTRAESTPVLLFAELEQSRLQQARAALPVLSNRRFITPQLHQEVVSDV